MILNVKKKIVRMLTKVTWYSSQNRITASQTQLHGTQKRAIRKQLLSNIKANSCTCGRRERGQEGEKQKHEQKPKRPTSPEKHTAFVPGPKLNIRKRNIMASGPITSWQKDGGKVETVSDFIFRGAKINVDSDCGHGIKRRLLLGRKTMTAY